MSWLCFFLCHLIVPLPVPKAIMHNLGYFCFKNLNEKLHVMIVFLLQDICLSHCSKVSVSLCFWNKFPFVILFCVLMCYDYDNFRFLDIHLIFIDCFSCAKQCILPWKYKDRQATALPSRSSVLQVIFNFHSFGFIFRS